MIERTGDVSSISRVLGLGNWFSRNKNVNANNNNQEAKILLNNISPTSDLAKPYGSVSSTSPSDTDGAKYLLKENDCISQLFQLVNPDLLKNILELLGRDAVNIDFAKEPSERSGLKEEVESTFQGNLSLINFVLYKLYPEALNTLENRKFSSNLNSEPSQSLPEILEKNNIYNEVFFNNLGIGPKSELELKDGTFNALIKLREAVFKAVNDDYERMIKKYHIEKSNEKKEEANNSISTVNIKDSIERQDSISQENGLDCPEKHGLDWHEWSSLIANESPELNKPTIRKCLERLSTTKKSKNQWVSAMQDIYARTDVKNHVKQEIADGRRSVLEQTIPARPALFAINANEYYEVGQEIYDGCKGQNFIEVNSQGKSCVNIKSQTGKTVKELFNEMKKEGGALSKLQKSLENIKSSYNVDIVNYEQDKDRCSLKINNKIYMDITDKQEIVEKNKENDRSVLSSLSKKIIRGINYFIDTLRPKDFVVSLKEESNKNITKYKNPTYKFIGDLRKKADSNTRGFKSLFVSKDQRQLWTAIKEFANECEKELGYEKSVHMLKHEYDKTKYYQSMENYLVAQKRKIDKEKNSRILDVMSEIMKVDGKGSPKHIRMGRA